MHVELLAPERPLSREEAARYLSTTINTLAGWAARGTGPRYSRSGRRRGLVWYTVADLDAWVESRKIAPPPHVEEMTSNE